MTWEVLALAALILMAAGMFLILEILDVWGEDDSEGGGSCDG